MPDWTSNPIFSLLVVIVAAPTVWLGFGSGMV